MIHEEQLIETMIEQKKRLNQALIDQSVYSTIGDDRRKTAFDNGKREALEQTVERFGVYDSCCNDCGFAAGSLLRPDQMQNVMEKLDAATFGFEPYAAFFCHREMEHIGCHPVPELDVDLESENCGLPKNAKLCPNWVQIARRKDQKANG